MIYTLLYYNFNFCKINIVFLNIVLFFSTLYFEINSLGSENSKDLNKKKKYLYIYMYIHLTYLNILSRYLKLTFRLWNIKR